MINNYISVTQLNNCLKRIMESEEMLHNIKLAGEVSGIKCSGPHCYFTLKDIDSQISCCAFNYKKTYMPRDGESVVLRGSIDYYVKGGRLSFNAVSIEPLGIGLLALKLEELKKKLLAGGYFAEEHKVAPPRFCENICVITSKTGAVIRDIITTARKNNSAINIDIYDVKVQGQGAAETIINAIKVVDTMNYDAVLIARGGGSLEDLMAFNDEQLVYAIYNARTPIVSAVGHETDYTLCDFASDIRVPTPTAGAELLAYNVMSLIKDFASYNAQMKKHLKGMIAARYQGLNAATRGLVSVMQLSLQRGEGSISKCGASMTQMANIKIADKSHQLSNIITRIDGNNPIKMFKQGYYKVYSCDGLPINMNAINVGDNMLTYGEDIKILSTAYEVTRSK